MANQAIDINIINPFLISAKNVVETMCHTKTEAKKPKLKDNSLTYGEVTGIIGMASSHIRGCMVISFSKKCILNIVSNMLMEEIQNDINEEIVDAVGELTNMICGGAKAALEETYHEFDMATPTMVVGTGLEISYQSAFPTITIPFTTEYGDFVIEANLGT
ncbi:MAG: chemotaxis protein CheX [Thermodesulfobacteriota bacterium]